MTLKRTRLFGCVRFVFYSGILRTAPLWVHIIRAVSENRTKGKDNTLDESSLPILVGGIVQIISGS